MASPMKKNSNSTETELSPDSMLVLVKCATCNVAVHDICVKKKKFKIGRSMDADGHILDPLISRNHCILNYVNEQWSIINLSLSGTHLNGKALELGVPEPINVGDVIQFSASEDFKFTVNMYIKDEPDKKKIRIDQSVLDEQIKEQKLFAEQQEKIRQELEDELMFKRKEQEELKAHLDEVMKSQEDAIGKNAEKNDTIKNLEEKIRSENEVITGLSKNYNQLLETMESQQKDFQQRLEAEKQKWQATLDMTNQEKEALKQKMTEEMTQWREEKQNEWKRAIDETIERENEIRQKLADEKAQLEQKLKEANEALQEKTKLAEKLQKEAEEIAVKKAASQVPLNEQDLVTIDLTSDTPGSSMNQAVGKVENIMDDQLTCQICSELFITAVTLNCCHSFCQFCIHTWIQKKRDCPICRQKIHTITKSIVIDNFIEQMVNDFSPQHRERRKELIDQRRTQAAITGLYRSMVIKKVAKVPNTRR